MFRLNLKIAWRNLWKNKAYSFINIAGLSIGMAGCMLIFIFVYNQLSCDKGYENEKRIYRLVTNWKYPAYDDFSKGVPIPLIDAARNDLDGLDKVAPIINRGGIIKIKDDNGKDIIKVRKSVFYAGPAFFEIFDIPWIYGKPKQALSEPNTVSLSENIAQQFYGSSENALGKSFLFDTKTNLRVTGVFKDMPKNSSFPLEIVISYETFNHKKYTYWDGVNSSTECYVLLKNGVSLTDMSQPLAKFNKKYYEDKKIAGNQRNELQALKDIHFDGKYGSFSNLSITKKELYGLSLIGIFLILTACINFINLATAQAVNRSKEVGVRKVMGGKRKQLIIQFLTETVSITSVSMLLACVITELALPALEKLLNGQVELSLFGHPDIFIFMAVLLVSVSFLAGFYPAMVMSGFSPVLAIKNKVASNTNGLNLRKVLVVFQFAITIILIIGTLVIMKQMEYLRQKPLGFNTGAVAMIDIPSDSLNQLKYNTFKEKVMQTPGIEALSFCQAAPLSDNITTSEFSYNGRKNTDLELRQVKADASYFNLFDLKLITGKIFKQNDNTNAFVVNETYLRKINISDPQQAIGKFITTNNYTMVITGVVKDYNDQPLQEKISPLIIYPQQGEYYSAAIKMDSKQMMQSIKIVEKLWNDTFPNYIYNTVFLNEDLNRYYENERITGILFKVSSAVILFISFIGLFGLISFVAKLRTREVAIRKVLGASTTELVKLLNGSFLLMVLLANVVAWPLAYVFVRHWLSGFAYKIDLSIWPFILAFVISILITLVTTTIKSYNAAMANAATALKYQ